MRLFNLLEAHYKAKKFDEIKPLIEKWVNDCNVLSQRIIISVLDGKVKGIDEFRLNLLSSNIQSQLRIINSDLRRNSYHSFPIPEGMNQIVEALERLNKNTDISTTLPNLENFIDQTHQLINQFYVSYHLTDPFYDDKPTSGLAGFAEPGSLFILPRDKNPRLNNKFEFDFKIKSKLWDLFEKLKEKLNSHREGSELVKDLEDNLYDFESWSIVLDLLTDLGENTAKERSFINYIFQKNPPKNTKGLKNWEK